MNISIIVILSVALVISSLCCRSWMLENVDLREAMRQSSNIIIQLRKQCPADKEIYLDGDREK